jgi:hypothetical protein
MGKGEGYARLAIRDARTEEARRARAEGRQPHKQDIMKIYQTRKVTAASEALARILEADIATWGPSVYTIIISEPRDEAEARRHLDECGNDAMAADKWVGDVERFFARPSAFSDLSIAQYFGQTAHITVAQHQSGKPIPQHARDCHYRDRSTINPWIVWKKERPGIARIQKINKINTERFWMRQLLMQPGSKPHSYEELRTVDGVLCDTFAAAASAAGLQRNEEVARRILDEERTDFLTTPERMRFLLVAVVRQLEKSGALLALVYRFLPDLLDPEWCELPQDDQVRLVLQVRILQHGS